MGTKDIPRLIKRFCKENRFNINYFEIHFIIIDEFHNMTKNNLYDENDNLYGDQFQSDDYWFPFLRNEIAEFSYPLSYENWLLLYGNPKGLIKFNCGTETKYGWILDLNYKPTTGMADFVLQVANYTEQ